MSDKLDIVYEDQDVIVLNKPAGLLVHPVKKEEKTLVSLIIKHCPKIREVGYPQRPGIVHRLDKDTSGLLIVAKNNRAYKYLVQQFKNRKIIKKYIALVFGKIKDKKGKIVYHLKRRGVKIGLGLEGKAAETDYQVIKYFNDFTLVEAQPKTGRTHQIRVHLHKIGHPIVGDKTYKFKRKKFPYPISRQFLHTRHLKLRLPSGKVMEFKVKLPKDLTAVINKLKK